MLYGNELKFRNSMPTKKILEMITNNCQYIGIFAADKVIQIFRIF